MLVVQIPSLRCLHCGAPLVGTRHKGTTEVEVYHEAGFGPCEDKEFRAVVPLQVVSLRNLPPPKLQFEDHSDD